MEAWVTASALGAPEALAGAATEARSGAAEGAAEGGGGSRWEQPAASRARRRAGRAGRLMRPQHSRWTRSDRVITSAAAMDDDDRDAIARAHAALVAEGT